MRPVAVTFILCFNLLCQGVLLLTLPFRLRQLVIQLLLVKVIERLIEDIIKISRVHPAKKCFFEVSVNFCVDSAFLYPIHA